MLRKLNKNQESSMKNNKSYLEFRKFAGILDQNAYSEYYREKKKDLVREEQKTSLISNSA